MALPRFFNVTKLQLAVIGVIVVAGILLVAISSNGRQSAYIPDDNSADAGFARDMIVHHDQAVKMSFIAREKVTNQETRTFAFDIINTQSVQSGMMTGWLQQWELPQSSIRPPMEWAHGSMGNHSGAMPGLASNEQIEKLATLSGKELEKYYLQLMIAHHHGGIEMAEAALKTVKDESALQLAQAIINGQQSEIDYMNQLLTTL